MGQERDYRWRLWWLLCRQWWRAFLRQRRYRHASFMCRSRCRWTWQIRSGWRGANARAAHSGSGRRSDSARRRRQVCPWHRMPARPHRCRRPSRWRGSPQRQGQQPVPDCLADGESLGLQGWSPGGNQDPGRTGQSALCEDDGSAHGGLRRQGRAPRRSPALSHPPRTNLQVPRQGFRRRRRFLCQLLPRRCGYYRWTRAD
mmetsp:Transcript_2751/g.4300  ORF Transcript_2751/g.4300 Transcript_2751/m.4300 type:complete len:201 (+) Transcript_2751:489-1091(+)